MWLLRVVCCWLLLSSVLDAAVRDAAVLATEMTTRYAPYADWSKVVDVDVLARQPSSRYWRTPEEIRAEHTEGALPLDGLHLALDPGHIGGRWAEDEGRHFRIAEEDYYVCEGELVLEVAQRVKDELVALGCEVTLLREENLQVNPRSPIDYLELAAEQVPEPKEQTVAALWEYGRALQGRAVRLSIVTGELVERTRLVNQEIQPDALISLHINAAAWPQRGSESESWSESKGEIESEGEIDSKVNNELEGKIESGGIDGFEGDSKTAEKGNVVSNNGGDLGDDLNSDKIGDFKRFESSEFCYVEKRNAAREGGSYGDNKGDDGDVLGGDEKSGEVSGFIARISGRLNGNIITSSNSRINGDLKNDKDGDALFVLSKSNHLHALIFGCMSAGELQSARQQEQLAVKLVNGSGAVEFVLGDALMTALAEATGLPASTYAGRNAILLDAEQPYLFARNLLMVRMAECPTVLLEPYVANSVAAYPRIQEALANRAAGRSLAEDDILVEYADAVIAGVLACYGGVAVD